MQLAFILPTHWERHVIARMQARIAAMTPQQIDYMQHLVRSWRCWRVADVERALRRTLLERP